MAIVSNAPGSIQGLHRRAIRSPINPLDKSTIVSIFPKVIREVKHTIEPGTFELAAGKYEKPAILVVGPSSWWREVDEDQPLLEIPVSSIQIADSFVKDWCNGLLACNMGSSMPGIFYIPGELTLVELLAKYKSQLDIAKARQTEWYKTLIKMGDVLWSRSGGNPLSISDDMRLAAQELQLKDKVWLKDYNTMELTNCPACGFLRNSNFPVCSNCKTILDKEAFKKLGLEIAS